MMQNMESCIYEGWVRHRRSTPVSNEFTYSIFLMYLDLSELENAFSKRWVWSTSRMAIGRFKRSDHFGDARTPLDDCVRNLVEERTGHRPTGPVRLLTHFRYFGYLMNPVSFFYCFHADGKTLQTVVAEVNNTPWGERHLYVIDQPVRHDGGTKRIWQDKQFHVSPFMQMDMRYRWLLTPPTDRLAVHIENHGVATPDASETSAGPGDRPFDVTMSLRKKPITSLNLTRVLLRYPLMTAKVTAAIYWQAVRLWWKGCPFVPHPKSKRDSSSTTDSTSSTQIPAPPVNNDTLKETANV